MFAKVVAPWLPGAKETGVLAASPLCHAVGAEPAPEGVLPSAASNPVMVTECESPPITAACSPRSIGGSSSEPLLMISEPVEDEPGDPGSSAVGNTQFAGAASGY